MWNIHFKFHELGVSWFQDSISFTNFIIFSTHYFSVDNKDWVRRLYTFLPERNWVFDTIPISLQPDGNILNFD